MVSRAPALLVALALSVALAGCGPDASGTPADDGAVVAAESSLAAAEAEATGGATDVAPGGELSDAAAAAAVASAAGAGSTVTSALAALAAVPVKGRAPLTGYTRDQFGSGWVDTDHNGCDTRNDVLRRDLTDDVLKPGTKGCVVLS